ncbi:MAG TPA: type 4a pilus biogenesis protein PilO [Tahibacter sp.]|uniref:type 4a pilus biogenesis protein PilO n=1 Tax=Tahibacter sp. TaxID=2056211 RepID=UPI002C14CCA8|nr:type 4a pilus biogenesis protein PilO [Tahibacter sp.]HSX59737.1 type 4a pilus biogenesis protein PilO [Tahibacter sp.]
MNAETGSPQGARRFAVAFGLIAGAVLGAWQLAAALDQVERGEAATMWLDDAIDAKRQQAANPDAYAQDVAAVRKDLALYEQRLPAQFVAAEIDAGLKALAERHGLTLGAIARDAEVGREFYASQRHRFELRGRTAALQAFFRDYEQIVPIQRVAELRVTVAPHDANALVAAVAVDYYRYLEDDARRY